ncbi:MAG: hypothetical protein ACFCVD_04175 [Nodosilinea sp.]
MTVSFANQLILQRFSGCKHQVVLWLAYVHDRDRNSTLHALQEELVECGVNTHPISDA